MTLQDFFSGHPRCALAFSGGADSAYLLYAGLRCGAELRPYYVKSQFQPDFEYRDAMRLCASLGAAVTVLPFDALCAEAVRQNGPDRCYDCKKNIMSTIIARAAEDGFPLLLDGSNASDVADDRPGMRALGELGVLSPLRLCGLTKPEIRRLSKEAGLFTWDKPAYACLATRVPAGVEITEDLLRRVEAAEGALFDLGFTDFRVRVFHGAARLQLPAGQLAEAVARREALRAALAPHFATVLLDLEDRG
jgi:ATP-utilizing enzymes of the PP-loop superfamily